MALKWREVCTIFNMEQLKPNVKSKPFSEYERNLAIALITKRVTILDGKKTDNVSLRAKKSEWNKVASEFNSSQNVQQSVSTLLSTIILSKKCA